MKSIVLMYVITRYSYPVKWNLYEFRSLWGKFEIEVETNIEYMTTAKPCKAALSRSPEAYYT